MGSKEILEQALKLKQEDRFMLLEGLIQSLDKPDHTLENIWTKEAELRLKAYRSGNLKGIPVEDVFKEKY